MHLDLATIKHITGIAADLLTIVTVIAGIVFAWPMYRAALKRLRDEAKDVAKKI